VFEVMARQFARVAFISRSKGGNAVRAAAYNMRSSLVDERTGQRFTFRGYGTLVHHEILLPRESDPIFADPNTLWSAVELAERRKDSVVARAVLLALPEDAPISNAERVAMVRGFAEEHFVSKGLPVQIDLHRASEAKDGAQVVNPHAHLLVATRQLEGDSFNRLKYTDEVRHAWGHGKRFVADGPDWGERWAAFQNDWFSRNGKSVRVDPVLPYATAHLGAKRFQRPLDHRVQNQAKIKELNRQVARDPAAAFAYLHEANALDDRSIDRFLGKFITDPQELAAVRDKVVELRSARREALEQQTWADRVPSGWRPLSIEDIAYELSPKFAELKTEGHQLHEAIRKVEWGHDRRNHDVDEAHRRIEERWNEMGLARQVLHLTGAHKDLKIQTLERWGKGNEYGRHKLSIRRGAICGKLDVVNRLAEAEFDKIRPAAEAELARRQQAANNAREELEQLNAMMPALSHTRTLRANLSA
jgi:hypothetical protein